MELTLDQALQRGIDAQKAGKPQEADRYYTSILKAYPKHSHANHNMGVLAVDIGKIQEALPFFKTAIEADPSTDQYWISYIDALIKLNRVSNATAVFNQARSNGAKGDSFDKLEKRLTSSESKNTYGQDPPKKQLDSLLKLYNQQKLQQVFNNAQRLTKRYSKSLTLWNLMGASAAQIGKLDEAVLAFKKALLIKPDYAEVHYNLGNAFRDQEKLQEAIEAYGNALSIKPDHADAYLNLGNALKDQGKLEEAIAEYKKACSTKPDYADAYLNLGNALKEQGRLDQAIDAYSKALSIRPDCVDAYLNMGAIFEDQEKLGEALGAYKKVISIKPDYADAHLIMGNVLKVQGKLDEAIEAYNKAISIKPDYADAHLNLSSIKKFTRKDEQFLQVQELYKSDGLSDEKRCKFSFTLAKMYEDVGELDQAFRHLFAGNALRKKLLKYSFKQDVDLFNRLKETQPHFSINSLEIKESSIKPTPIFILGMPRSGTSLVEQIISSHSKVAGAGELKLVQHLGKKLPLSPKSMGIEAISEFRQRYLSELSKLSHGKHFVTDKMPHNFLFIPLICAAFPEAKIVHVQRSPAATCWSNYKQYFAVEGLGYCYDLKDVVSYYSLYSDLMEFWQSEYSDRIYNLNYEKLTTDQEGETRELIDILGLDWNKACLSPHKNKRRVRTASIQQVRKKVYQGSSEVWREYEPYLGRAFNNLPSS